MVHHRQHVDEYQSVQLEQVQQSSANLPAAAASPEAPASQDTLEAARIINLTHLDNLWRISRGSTEIALFNKANGFWFLSYLLKRPGETFSSVAIFQATVGSKELGMMRTSLDPDGSIVEHDWGAAHNVVDKQTIQSAKKRIQAIDAELAADSGGENPEEFIEHKQELEQERKEIEAYLKQSTGKFGKSRKTGNSLENARSNVTQQIRKVIKDIAAKDAELGAHLESTVFTGTSCTYQPDPQHPIHWNVMF